LEAAQVTFVQLLLDMQPCNTNEEQTSELRYMFKIWSAKLENFQKNCMGHLFRSKGNWMQTTGMLKSWMPGEKMEERLHLESVEPSQA